MSQSNSQGKPLLLIPIFIALIISGGVIFTVIYFSQQSQGVSEEQPIVQQEETPKTVSLDITEFEEYVFEQKELSLVTPVIEPYSVRPTLSDVENRRSVALSGREVSVLAKEHVLTRESDHVDLLEFYQNLPEELPVVITSDLVMSQILPFEQYVYETIEQEFLGVDLLAFADAMSPIASEFEQYAKQTSWEEAAFSWHRVLYVVKGLLNEDAFIPEEVDELVQKEFARLQSDQTQISSELFDGTLRLSELIDLKPISLANWYLRQALSHEEILSVASIQVLRSQEAQRILPRLNVLNRYVFGLPSVISEAGLMDIKERTKEAEHTIDLNDEAFFADLVKREGMFENEMVKAIDSNTLHGVSATTGFPVFMQSGPWNDSFSERSMALKRIEEQAHVFDIVRERESARRSDEVAFLEPQPKLYEAYANQWVYLDSITQALYGRSVNALPEMQMSMKQLANISQKELKDQVIESQEVTFLQNYAAFWQGVWQQLGKQPLKTAHYYHGERDIQVNGKIDTVFILFMTNDRVFLGQGGVLTHHDIVWEQEEAFSANQWENILREEDEIELRDLAN